MVAVLCKKDWKIKSINGQEKIILRDLKEQLSELSLPKNRIDEMITAVSEACLNAMEHGNQWEETRFVEVTMSIDSNACIFRVYDEGVGFRELTRSDIPLQKYIEPIPRGWGLLFILTFSDYTFISHECNKFYVEMVFILDK